MRWGCDKWKVSSSTSLVDVDPKEIFNVSFFRCVQSCLLDVGYDLLKFFLVQTSEEGVIGAQCTHDVSATECALIVPALFKADLRDWLVHWMLIPDSPCLLLSADVLVNSQCPFSRSVDLDSFGNLHVAFPINRGLRQSQRTVQLDCVPAVSKHQCEQDAH